MSEIISNSSANLTQTAKELCRKTWWAYLLGGIASVAFGVFAYMKPGMALLVLSMFFGFTQISLGVHVRKEIKGEWILYLTGLLSVMFGILILFRVEIGGLTIVYLIAFWAIVIGIMRIVFAFRARAFGRSEAV